VNILVVGGDTKGAWQMRGRQLGRAMGARVTALPMASDWAWADIAVLVKHAAQSWQEHTRRLTVPVVWDVLDVWAQPEDNQKTQDELVQSVRAIQAAAGVGVIVGATKAMGDDLGGVYLTHHARLDLGPWPIRPKATTVGYDGNKKYLGRWISAVEHACVALGLRFVLSPDDLRDVDVLVSFRDGRWDGWVCRQWKSGVKHVNAIVAGRPILSQASAAQAELDPVGAVIDKPEQVEDALKTLVRTDVRAHAYEQGVKRHREFTLPSVAASYASMLQHLVQVAA
jgi:hypothetical protein